MIFPRRKVGMLGASEVVRSDGGTFLSPRQVYGVLEDYLSEESSINQSADKLPGGSPSEFTNRWL